VGATGLGLGEGLGWAAGVGWGLGEAGAIGDRFVGGLGGWATLGEGWGFGVAVGGGGGGTLVNEVIMDRAGVGLGSGSGGAGGSAGSLTAKSALCNARESSSIGR